MKLLKFSVLKGLFSVLKNSLTNTYLFIEIAIPFGVHVIAFEVESLTIFHKSDGNFNVDITGILSGEDANSTQSDGSGTPSMIQYRTYYGG